MRIGKQSKNSRQMDALKRMYSHPRTPPHEAAAAKAAYDRLAAKGKSSRPKIKLNVGGMTGAPKKAAKQSRRYTANVARATKGHGAMVVGHGKRATFGAGKHVGRNVGSFKGRGGSWVKGKGGRFMGSR